VTVERSDPSLLRIEWDEVPEIDGWIAAGHPVFTDPDSVEAHLREASPPSALKRPHIDGPSGRILAVGREDGNATKLHGEILLSVSVPGAPRRGLRWTGWIPTAKTKFEWWDVPIEVDPDKPDKVKILWDQVPGIEVVTPLLSEANDQMEALIAEPWTPSSPPAAPPPPDPLAQLEQLGKLRDAGALTEAEFAAEKARLLGGM
jgi:hypothetical protein